MAEYDESKHLEYDRETGDNIYIDQPDGCFSPTFRSDSKFYIETSSGPFRPICEMCVDYTLKFAYIKSRNIS